LWVGDSQAYQVKRGSQDWVNQVNQVNQALLHRKVALPRPTVARQVLSRRARL
jgi:hypothetical protein